MPIVDVGEGGWQLLRHWADARTPLQYRVVLADEREEDCAWRAVAIEVVNQEERWIAVRKPDTTLLVRLRFLQADLQPHESGHALAVTKADHSRFLFEEARG